MDADKSPRDTTREGTDFLERLGARDLRIEADGAVVLDLVADESHQNMGGIVHGGVHLALLDAVLGTAVAFTLAEGEWTATQSLTTDFLRASEGGLLRARGRVDRRGKLTAFVSGMVVPVEGEREGEPLARATGVWAIRRG